MWKEEAREAAPSTPPHPQLNRHTNSPPPSFPFLEDAGFQDKSRKHLVCGRMLNKLPTPTATPNPQVFDGSCKVLLSVMVTACKASGYRKYIVGKGLFWSMFGFALVLFLGKLRVIRSCMNHKLGILVAYRATHYYKALFGVVICIWLFIQRLTKQSLLPHQTSSFLCGFCLV